MNSKDLQSLGNAVRQYRTQLGLSQEELAFKAGFHRTYIGMIERGERNISYLNLLKLCAALEIAPFELLSFLK